MGIDELNGVILCNDEYASGQVVYRIQMKAIEGNQSNFAIGQKGIILLGAVVIVCVLVVIYIRHLRRSKS